MLKSERHQELDERLLALFDELNSLRTAEAVQADARTVLEDFSRRDHNQPLDEWLLYPDWESHRLDEKRLYSARFDVPGERRRSSEEFRSRSKLRDHLFNAIESLIILVCEPDNGDFGDHLRENAMIALQRYLNLRGIGTDPIRRPSHGDWWLTVGDAAKASGCEKGKISRAATNGELGSNGKVGPERRISAASLSRWLIDQADRPNRTETDAAVKRKLEKADQA